MDKAQRKELVAARAEEVRPLRMRGYAASALDHAAARRRSAVPGQRPYAHKALAEVRDMRRGYKPLP